MNIGLLLIGLIVFIVGCIIFRLIYIRRWIIEYCKVVGHHLHPGSKGSKTGFKTDTIEVCFDRSLWFRTEAARANIIMITAAYEFAKYCQFYGLNKKGIYHVTTTAIKQCSFQNRCIYTFYGTYKWGIALHIAY